jgi:hypothetical protein
MRLSIGGLEIQPGVWRGALDGGAYESDASDDRAAGVALGYVAQVPVAYLSIPRQLPGCMMSMAACLHCTQLAVSTLVVVPSCRHSDFLQGSLMAASVWCFADG